MDRVVMVEGLERRECSKERKERFYGEVTSGRNMTISRLSKKVGFANGVYEQ